MRTPLLLATLASLALAASANAVLLNDGAVHTIADGTYAGDSLHVRNVGCGSAQNPAAPCPSPGAPTTVTLATGGSVAGVVVRDSSAFTLAGGSVNFGIDSYGSSAVSISDGTVASAVVSNDTATSTISGGTLSSGLWTFGSSAAALSGGVVWGVDARGSSAVTLSGGVVQGVIWAKDTATISIVGYAFAIDGAPAGFGPIAATSANVTGTLESGNALDNTLVREPSSVILLVPAPGTEILVNHGGSETLDDATFSQSDVYVRNVGCGTPADPAAGCTSPGGATALDLASGGSVVNLIVYETSTATISGGNVAQQLLSDDSAQIAMSGGTVAVLVEIGGASRATLSGGAVSTDGGDVGLIASGTSEVTLSGVSVAKVVEARDSSTITLSGGYLGRDLLPYDTAHLVINGGVVGGALASTGSSVVTMSGGSVVEHLNAYGSSTVTLSGGSVGSTYIRAWESSSISVVGSGFKIDGGEADYGPIASTSGTLAGTLESGDGIDIPFYHGGYDWYGDGSVLVSGTITLVPVPEPGLALLQGAVLLCVAAMAGRRRAREAAQQPNPRLR